MGVSLNLIAVRPVTTQPVEILLSRLGFEGVEALGQSTLADAYTIDEQTVGVGYHGDALLIVHPNAVVSVIEPELDSMFETLKDCLVNVTHCQQLGAFYLLSTVNGYGWALTDGTNYLRRVIGDYETHMDDGRTLLPEESSLYTRIETENDKAVFVRGGRREELNVWAEEVVFELSKRFFGNRLDQLDWSAIPVDLFEFKYYKTG